MKDDQKELSDIQRFIVTLILANNKITIPELARKVNVSESTISREIKTLRNDFNKLRREGGRRDGYWVVVRTF